MKVILLQAVEDVGKKYEVKEGKDGYARNFLIPQKLVKLANKANIKWLESQKETMDIEAEEDLKKIQELASKIDDMEIPMSVKVGTEGQMFEAINQTKIADKLKEMGYEVKKSQIILEKPIKEVGEFPVKLTLDHNLEAEIKLIISGVEEGKEDDTS